MAYWHSVFESDFSTFYIKRYGWSIFTMQIDKSKVFGVYNNQHTSIFIYFKKSAEGGGVLFMCLGRQIP